MKLSYKVSNKLILIKCISDRIMQEIIKADSQVLQLCDVCLSIKAKNKILHKRMLRPNLSHPQCLRMLWSKQALWSNRLHKSHLQCILQVDVKLQDFFMISEEHCASSWNVSVFREKRKNLLFTKNLLCDVPIPKSCQTVHLERRDRVYCKSMRLSRFWVPKISQLSDAYGQLMATIGMIASHKRF